MKQKTKVLLVFFMMLLPLIGCETEMETYVLPSSFLSLTGEKDVFLQSIQDVLGGKEQLIFTETNEGIRMELNKRNVNELKSFLQERIKTEIARSKEKGMDVKRYEKEIHITLLEEVSILDFTTLIHSMEVYCCFEEILDGMEEPFLKIDVYDGKGKLMLTGSTEEDLHEVTEGE